MGERLNYRDVYLDPLTVGLLRDTGEALQCGYDFCFAVDNREAGIDVYRAQDGSSRGAVFLTPEDIETLSDSESGGDTRCVRIPRAAFNNFDPADRALVDQFLPGADGIAIRLGPGF